MSKINKILLIVVIVLILALAGVFAWKWWGASSYYAVYLRTGDLYFGQLVRFPSFGLKNIYTIQVNSQNQQNPLSIQKFTNIFWSPTDFMKINREQVVWTTRLNDTGQLVQLIKTNPDLVPPAGTQQAPPATQEPSTNK
ncbi:MAG: hypothetical protein UY23_C0001G0318 [Candidatus Jorgensenbacteria bacterium GW2011_GWA1_48_11]|uniref:Uncharacterized protein n=1 Tax=Candidatus Jorgensenbacteria bacterium GW2011_GWA1_48_11 TaxID=1618660 RepID=A0A0G1UC64_9BACT|nr:MAG: hypothetical protein UY23_C0001G0318 [Candidatus Jorgensenbacteria bacterium GW2011_GWA1_48_11]KKW12203.1 MAG: hypothetical protein UY51_C0005G0445 [Candidatus Jorgensenbacteria bacterium GW2011_GWB1_49_9]